MVILNFLLLLLRIVQWLYLARMPVLTAVGIVVLCIASRFGPASTLLVGIFDIGNNRAGAFSVSLLAFLTAWVVVANLRIIRLYGPLRFSRSPNPPKGNFDRGDMERFLYYFLILLVAGTVVGFMLYTSNASWQQMIAAAGGTLVAFLCIVVLVLCQLSVNRKRIPGTETPDLFLPTRFGLVPWLRGGWRQTLGITEPGSVEATSPSSYIEYADGVSGGYLYYEVEPQEETPQGVSPEQPRRTEHRLPGHPAAALLLLLTLAFYALVGTVKWSTMGPNFWVTPDTDLPLIPALCYVLLLAALFCWVFSGLAFFLDYYRVPVLAAAILWLAISTFPQWSDYKYRLVPKDSAAYSQEEVASLTEVATGGDDGKNDGGKAEDNSIIVVAVNGGGIQAAAWSAQVLAGLEQACRTECGREFDEEVRLISSVSGGSVGTMYFANEYEDGRIPEGPPGEGDAVLRGIVRRAQGSSIDEISWGVVYPDLVRTIFSYPIPFGWDRGEALEEAWLRRDLSWDRRGGVEQGLLEWKAAADDGDRPAVIFNTTVAETGHRLPLATTVLPEGSPGRLTYDEFFAPGTGKDVPVVTAARLSASFPYVSPAARAKTERQESHLVDGGYYDNYGISSLVEWLDAELHMNQEINEVLIIEIRGSPLPNTQTPEEAADCGEKVNKEDGPKSKRGSSFQFTAPLDTVLGVRDTGQRDHNKLELDLLVDKWDAQGDEEQKGKVPQEAGEQGSEEENGPRRVAISRAHFEFDCEDTPLSWHLSDADKDRIETNWHQELTQPEDKVDGWKKVKSFLAEDKGGQ